MAQSPKTSLQIVRQAPETVTDRIKALQSQMNTLAAQQSAELRGAMLEAQRIAADVANCPAHPPGVRDLARRLSDDLANTAQTIDAIMARAG